MDRGKIILIGVSALIVIVVVFIATRGKKKSADKVHDIGGNNNKVIHKGDSFPLSEGSRGDNVRRLQKALNLKATEKLAVDGIFGPKTKAELLKQRSLSTVSKNDIVSMEGADHVDDSKVNPSSLSSDLQLLSYDIRYDIFERTYPFGRGEDSPYSDVIKLSDADLISLADIFKSSNNMSLFKAIDDAYFSAFSKADSVILNRLRDLKKTK